MTAAADGSVTEKLWGRVQDWIRRMGRKPKIGVTLGGGAAWGVAHIGVLSVLRELQIPISYLSGCSAGAFIGALYAGGIEGPELEACGRDYGWRDAGRLVIPPKMGLATNERMAVYLQRKIGRPRFDQLRLPFFVVATDLTSGEGKTFHEGPVIPAVRASCAVPGIFEPIEINGELYVDGSLVDRLPCEVLRKAGADVVIGVELGNLNVKKRPANMSEVINRSIEIVLRCQAAADVKSADLVIRPTVEDLSEFGFNQNRLLIERGRQAALDQLTHWPQLHTPIAAPRADAAS